MVSSLKRDKKANFRDTMALYLVFNLQWSFTISAHQQCSKWTGTHRNGVPVREMLRYHRSVSWRYAGTHQNAVPVRYFSIIITFSLHIKSVLEIRASLSPT